VANAIGPLAAIYGVIDSGGLIGSKSSLPVGILLVGGVGIVFGLAIKIFY
jgi:PiT family inorganic phosphate transporter